MPDLLETIIALVLGILIGALITFGICDTYWRNKTVDRGVAEYYINDQQDKDWRWTTNTAK